MVRIYALPLAIASISIALLTGITGASTTRASVFKPVETYGTHLDPATYGQHSTLHTKPKTKTHDPDHLHNHHHHHHHHEHEHKHESQNSATKTSDRPPVYSVSHTSTHHHHHHHHTSSHSAAPSPPKYSVKKPEAPTYRGEPHKYASLGARDASNYEASLNRLLQRKPEAGAFERREAAEAESEGEAPGRLDHQPLESFRMAARNDLEQDEFEVPPIYSKFEEEQEQEQSQNKNALLKRLFGFGQVA